MHSYRFIIRGKVQGVWYRKSIQANASKKGFSGYVKNCEDGSVEAAVTLRYEDFSDFIEILENGSEMSRIDEIEQYESNEHFSGEFEIRY